VSATELFAVMNEQAPWTKQRMQEWMQAAEQLWRSTGRSTLIPAARQTNFFFARGLVGRTAECRRRVRRRRPVVGVQLELVA
jgi:hypothetical protein